MAFNKKTIKDVDIKHGTRVFMRADFNVPLNENGTITDDYRIQTTLPTIEYLIEKGAALVIMSHLGRPEGKSDPKLSLAPVSKYLEDYLESPVEFVDDIVGEKAKQAVANMEPGTLLLLENIRFNPGDEVNDPEFAKELASYGELFVLDGFGVSHRTHASTVGVAEHLPSVAGLLLEKEVDKITEFMEKPKRPMLAIIGGAKISDKIDALNNLIDISDMVAIGGAMANTFHKARGMDIGNSVYEKETVGLAEQILEKVERKQTESEFTFYVPEDGVVSDSLEATNGVRIVDWGSQTIADLNAYPNKPDASAYELGEKDMILDIGPASASYIAGLIRSSKTVVWNGNLGYTETRSKMGTIGPFEHGSHRILNALDKKHAPKDQFSFVGGGDTASYVLKIKEVALPDLVSTGGGAALDLMAGKTLPGVEALDNRN